MEANSPNSLQRLQLEVTGIVQGVGFRPFVYQLALKHSLDGYVLNNGSGVVIELQGYKASLKECIQELKEKKPSLARIDTIETKELVLGAADGFFILKSNQTDAITMVSPDMSLCQDCKNEMNDPTNRRYKYPFINCTNCGPRYTIVNSLPYDRKNTSMQNFEMCEACREEYEDPLNRRFHAQPISCYECGPTLRFTKENVEQNHIEKFVSLLHNGRTLALKGLGGFHLVCDATNENAIRELRENKNRPTKPLAVMFKSIDEIREIAHLSVKDEELICSKERPIVVVRKKENNYLAPSIAPNIDRIGVFLAYTPLHELVLEQFSKPMIATSANMSDAPIITNEKELFEKLPLVIEDALSNDREILNACDDSVICSVGDEHIFFRQARGFSPQSFYTDKVNTKKILALGAHQKSTITLAFDEHIIISPHIGDLNTLESFEYFLKTIETFQRFYNFKPGLLVCDMHPEYETHKWAKEYIRLHPEVELVEVQHHFAHALSCMAEYNLDEEMLAFCFDGTGYGDDGTLWGGEVLRVTPNGYTRVYHMQEFSLLGGEKAVKEPKRVALALLFELFTKEQVLEMDNELIHSFSDEEIHNYFLMYSKALNTPRSSSIGRLFDAVYALSGNLENIAYEGESGLVVERYAQEYPSQEKYLYSVNDGVIEYKEILLGMLQEKDKILIASKFINTLSHIILELSLKHLELPVLLSGGVFQNKTLLEKTIKLFKEHKIRYYLQNKTAINDGGISFGQAYYALHNT